MGRLGYLLWGQAHGKSPRSKVLGVDMLSLMGQKLVPQEVHLTISITKSLVEMNRILKNFSVMKPNRIMFTKLDESDSYGSMLSFALISQKPLSYVTHGQNVPGDFNVMKPQNIVENILEPKKSENEK